MTVNKKKVLQIILITLIVLNLAFIFGQSILPPEKSGEVSDKVGDVIEGVIPPETPVGGFVQKNVRKLAHFFEFFALGMLVSAYVSLFIPKIKWALHTAPLAFIIASFDETVQIFSGRGPSVRDVWIDFFGFLTSSLIFYTVYTLILFTVKRCRGKKRGANG